MIAFRICSAKRSRVVTCCIHVDKRKIHEYIGETRIIKLKAFIIVYITFIDRYHHHYTKYVLQCYFAALVQGQEYPYTNFTYKISINHQQISIVV